MITENTLPANPYILLQKETLSIQCGKQSQQIALKNINKIHISKHKAGQWSGMVGQLLFIPETDYNLNIETTDNGCLKIRINMVQRFFCIKLVNILRKEMRGQQLSF